MQLTKKLSDAKMNVVLWFLPHCRRRLLSVILRVKVLLSVPIGCYEGRGDPREAYFQKTVL